MEAGPTKSLNGSLLQRIKVKSTYEHVQIINIPDADHSRSFLKLFFLESLFLCSISFFFFFSKEKSQDVSRCISYLPTCTN